ncbi:MAG TPA: DNA-binding protein, partial [Thermoanaerobaculia bacterium]
VLATLFTAAEPAIRLAGPEHFSGKVLIDVTNPLDFSSGAPRLAVGHTDSAGEQIQRLLPQARVVKAFNIVGAPHMFRPQFPGGPPDMFYCGDDDAAKAQVREILEAFGWNPIDIGGIEGSRLLEPLAMLWIEHGRRTSTWNHAFKLLKR